MISCPFSRLPSLGIVVKHAGQLTLIISQPVASSWITTTDAFYSISFNYTSSCCGNNFNASTNNFRNTEVHSDFGFYLKLLDSTDEILKHA